MDKGMKVAILWHMHQPRYIDTEVNIIMPWVFLHAIKDYYDMPHIADVYGANVTFNLTPILIEQLNIYANKGISKDIFLNLLKKQTSDLTDREKQTVIRYCKSPNYNTMIKPFALYDRLYKKNNLTDDDIVSLEVCFLLSWCGHYLRENNEVVKGLLNRSGFSEEDKAALLNELEAFIPKILPYYKKLLDDGLISITTTPYYHPILPLLVDMRVAKEANSQTILPKNHFSLKEDAALHIEKAKELYLKTFSKEPNGFWPAEGGISKDVVELFYEHGIKYTASDETILRKSGDLGHYRAYQYNGVKLFFRDTQLSNLIGFDYKYISEDEAVSDFIRRLKEIRGEIVFVILDGENPWEYYKNNGWDFLNVFYKKLKDRFELATFDETSAMDAIGLSDVKRGSWIFGNFNTWVGNEEKNLAWELLFQARKDCYRHNSFGDNLREQFLIAESSDWFWWYGDDHYTQFGREFDKLFRENLIDIYRKANIPPPQSLFRPIAGSMGSENRVQLPKDAISPTIDGKVTSFFEWIDAGVVDERVGGAMSKGQIPVEVLYFGENDDKFFIRLDGNVKNKELFVFINDNKIEYNGTVNEIAEFEIEKSNLPDEFDLKIEVFEDGKLLQILPSTPLAIQINSVYYKNWYI